MTDVLKSVFPASLLSSLRPDDLDVHRHLERIFVKVDDWSRKQQRMLRRVLNLADRYGQLNLDTTRRLQSPNPVPFWGKLNELMVADLFDRAGVKLVFNPPGSGAHEGEFIAHLQADVFVEVKTMFPKPADAKQKRYLKLLCVAAEKVDVPAWILLEIRKLPITDFSSRPFRGFLAAQLPGLVTQLPDETSPLEFTDPKCGLAVSVVYGAKLVSGPVSASPFSGMKALTDRQSAEASIEKAYEQLPTASPNLVILCSRLQLPPSPRLIRDALGGTTEWTVKTSDLGSGKKSIPAELTRKDDGFFARCAHKRMSAVGVLDEVGMKYNPEPELVIHHHPCPEKSIDAVWLLNLTRRQEVVTRKPNPSGGSTMFISHPFDLPWPKDDSDGYDSD